VKNLRIKPETSPRSPTGTAGNANITRPFNGFRELANERARSRVYGGIHFEFDQLASFGQCIPLAD